MTETLIRLVSRRLYSFVLSHCQFAFCNRPGIYQRHKKYNSSRLRKSWITRASWPSKYALNPLYQGRSCRNQHRRTLSPEKGIALVLISLYICTVRPKPCAAHAKCNLDLTHFRLNRLFHTINWKSLITILGTSGYEILIFLEKNG